jgi:hypothetical protein
MDAENGAKKKRSTPGLIQTTQTPTPTPFSQSFTVY